MELEDLLPEQDQDYSHELEADASDSSDDEVKLPKVGTLIPVFLKKNKALLKHLSQMQLRQLI